MSSETAVTGNTYNVFTEYLSQSPISVEEDGSKFYVISQFHTDKLIPKDVLKRDFQTAFNKEIRCFHISPEDDVRSFVGVVNKLWWDEDVDEPMVKIEIFDDTLTARAMRGIITEDINKPLKDRRIKGISAGLLETRNKLTKEIVKFHAREVSLAREPACDDCTIKSISTFESGKMPKDESQPQDETLVALFEKMSGSLQETIDSQGQLIEELNAKIERYEKTIILQKDKIGQLEGDLQSNTTQVKNFEKEIAGERQKAEVAIKSPLVTQILKYEHQDEKTDEGKKRKDELTEESVKALSKMISGYDRVKELNARGLGERPEGSFSPGSVQPDDLPIMATYEKDPAKMQAMLDAMIDKNTKSGQRIAGDVNGPVSGGY